MIGDEPKVSSRASNSVLCSRRDGSVSYGRDFVLVRATHGDGNVQLDKML